MTAPGSHPRLRLQLLAYALALAATAVSGGRLLEGGAGLAAQSAGFVLVAGAVLWRIWTTLFVAGRKDVELVRDGPYAACRHPLYLGSVVAALGVGLTTRSLALTLALPLVIGAAAARAARREDAALAAAHGHAWLGYRAATRAFWPAWRRMRSPERVTVPLAIYRKAFLDAASFLALWLLVLLVETLRAGGAWRAAWVLP
ncbi:MAG TPA: methyltransferase [Steroidobacteraceae bacterium]|nr:methyltransferase [Steroidobacteraceae bacterium]